MKVRYQGTSPVDIAGHFDVQPGAVVDVPTEQGNALLLAGTSIDAEGHQTPPEAPLWVAEGGKPPKAPKNTGKPPKAPKNTEDPTSAEAGKDAQ